jgi:adenylate kinase family enzyme
MALYFVTGIAGSGKSALTHNLRERGFEAYDTDDDALSRWQHIKTGYIHPKSSVKSHQRTDEFLRQHRWNVPREFVVELAQKAESKPVFMCGVADNAAELSDLFRKVFALVIDDTTLEQRLLTRTNNDWGKQPHELAVSLRSNQRANELYEKLGYIIIDACRPQTVVLDDILSRVEE